MWRTHARLCSHATLRTDYTADLNIARGKSMEYAGRTAVIGVHWMVELVRLMAIETDGREGPERPKLN